MMLAAIGVVAGLAGAFGLTRVMASLLFNVRPDDPTTYLAISFLLTAVAFLACYLPARRAAKLDPVIALNHNA
jgi:putative ABC transport system permease protein